MKFVEKFVGAAFMLQAVGVASATCPQGECLDPTAEDPSGVAMKEAMLRDCPNAVLDGVKLQPNLETGTRTLVSTKTVKQGDIVMTVPLNCALSSSYAKAETSIGKALFEKQDVVDKLTSSMELPIALYFLERANNPDDKFQAYMNALPKGDLSHIPSFWSDEEKEWLKGTNVLNIQPERASDTENDYKLICNVDPVFCEQHSLEDFRRALYMVTTRTFHLTLKVDESSKEAYLMVPIVDLMNHNANYNVKWIFSSEDNQFEVFAQNTISAGDELITSYGKKPNSELLALYGFAIRDNYHPNNIAPDTVNVTLADTTGNKKPAWFMLSESFSSDDTRDALAYIRMTVASTEAEKKHIEAFKAIGLDGSNDKDTRRIFLGVDNEVRALKALAEVLSERIQQYKYSSEEASKMLEDPENLTSNQQNALKVLISEQKVCQFWIEAATAFDEFFAENKGTRLMAMLRFYPKKSKVDFYRHQYAAWLHGRLVSAEAKRDRGLTDIV